MSVNEQKIVPYTHFQPNRTHCLTQMSNLNWLEPIIHYSESDFQTEFEEKLAFASHVDNLIATFVCTFGN